MTAPKSEFIKVIQERGYFHQCTDLAALDALAAKGPMTAYIGFDPTADSLHVGSMVQIMLLRRLQQTGHRPIALMGGGTTKIGDPTGRDDSRKMLSVDDINHNLERIKRQVSPFMDFSGGHTAAIMVNNADWLDQLNYIEFLRDFGQHFSVNRMLTFDSVKLRLEREQTLSFLEFNYMILQAYDFLELARRFDCRLQLGGSDQWGNIVNGVELGRRVDGRELFGLTTPLITTASGAKMGKTAAGAVWLSEDRLSPYDYWQYWRNTEDADVGRFLRLFTDLPLSEIARLEKLQGAEINEAKIILANEATTLCHGAEAARNAAETARRTFVEGGLGQGLPTVEIDRAELDYGIPAHELFRISGLATSNSNARQKIKERAARLNDIKISDENYRVSSSDLVPGGVLKLSIGPRRHAVVRAIVSQDSNPIILVKRHNELRKKILARLKQMGLSALATTSPAFALKYLEISRATKVVCSDFTILGSSISGPDFHRAAQTLRPNLAFVVLLNEGTDPEVAFSVLGSARNTSLLRRDQDYNSQRIASEIARKLLSV